MGAEKNRRFYGAAMAVLACVFLGSSGMFLKDWAENAGQKKVYEELAGRFGAAEDGGPDAGAGTLTEGGQPGKGDGQETESRSARQTEWAARVPVYEKMRQENPDFVGWVRIPGTRIDYPVVQSRERPDYYLYRDFYGKESSFGTPYLAEECILGDPAWGLLICGHHMKNGEMFAGLAGYEDQEFWQDHREICFDTLEDFGDYEVAAVVKLSASDQRIPWQELIFPRSGQERQQAWKEFLQKRFYDTGVELTEEDEILCLVTCEYTLKDGRLMVIGRKKQKKPEV